MRGFSFKMRQGTQRFQATTWTRTTRKRGWAETTHDHRLGVPSRAPQRVAARAYAARLEDMNGYSPHRGLRAHGGVAPGLVPSEQWRMGWAVFIPYQCSSCAGGLRRQSAVLLQRGNGGGAELDQRKSECNAKRPAA